MSKLLIRYKQINDLEFEIKSTSSYSCNSKKEKENFYRATMSELMHEYGLLRPGYEIVLIDGEIFYDCSYRNLKESYTEYFDFIDEEYSCDYNDINTINLGMIN